MIAFIKLMRAADKDGQPDGAIFVNLERVADIRRVHQEGIANYRQEHDKTLITYPGGEDDFTYVVETPEQIMAMVPGALWAVRPEQRAEGHDHSTYHGTGECLNTWNRFIEGLLDATGLDGNDYDTEEAETLLLDEVNHLAKVAGAVADWCARHERCVFLCRMRVERDDAGSVEYEHEETCPVQSIDHLIGRWTGPAASV